MNAQLCSTEHFGTLRNDYIHLYVCFNYLSISIVFLLHLSSYFLSFCFNCSLILIVLSLLQLVVYLFQLCLYFNCLFMMCIYFLLVAYLLQISFYINCLLTSTVSILQLISSSIASVLQLSSYFKDCCLSASLIFLPHLCFYFQGKDQNRKGRSYRKHIRRWKHQSIWKFQSGWMRQ